MLTRLFPFHNLVDKWLRQKVPYTWLHSLIIAILFFGSLCLFVIPAELYSREASNSGLAVGLIFYICSGFLLVNFKKKDELVTVSGDLGKADFVRKEQLKKAQLINGGSGIVFGKLKQSFVERPTDKDGHVAIVGGTRTGKTSSNLIPTIVRWHGTGLILDVKPEILAKTGHLKENKKVISLKSKQDCYNPLQFIQTISDVLDLSKILILIPPDIKETYFKTTAQNILASASWEFKETLSFSDLAAWLCDTQASEIVEYLQKSSKRETRMLINAVDNIKTEQLASVMNELRNTLIPYAIDEQLRYITGSNGVTLDDIETNWIYIELEENKLDVYNAFLALVISQFVKYLAGRKEYQEPRILLALDEFSRIGKMDLLVDSIATLGGRGVTTMILFQSLAQLDKVYGADSRKIIMDNIHYTLVHNATDTESQKYFSDRAGMKTSIVQSMSRDNDRWSLKKNHSYNQQSAPLIRPEDFANLEKPILFAYQVGICRIEKSYWFKNTEMSHLLEGDR